MFLTVSQCVSGIHRWNHTVLYLWKCSLPNIMLGCDSMKHLWPISSQQALQVCCQPLRLHGIYKLLPREEIASEMKVNTNKRADCSQTNQNMCEHSWPKAWGINNSVIIWCWKFFVHPIFVVVGDRQNIRNFPDLQSLLFMYAWHVKVNKHDNMPTAHMTTSQTNQICVNIVDKKREASMYNFCCCRRPTKYI